MTTFTHEQLAERWKDPTWAFHNESTYWYDIARSGGYTLSVKCTQETKIVLGGDGIGYDIAVPGSYEIDCELYEELESGLASRDYGCIGIAAGTHSDLERAALAWLLDWANHAVETL